MNEFLVLLGFAAGLVAQLRLARPDCSLCDGTACRACTWCGGTGRGPATRFSNAPPCMNCHGRGEVPCNHCDGRGYRNTEHVIRWRDL
jgi:DnaJ-class molecular chaperone